MTHLFLSFRLNDLKPVICQFHARLLLSMLNQKDFMEKQEIQRYRRQSISKAKLQVEELHQIETICSRSHTLSVHAPCPLLFTTEGCQGIKERSLNGRYSVCLLIYSASASLRGKTWILLEKNKRKLFRTVSTPTMKSCG